MTTKIETSLAKKRRRIRERSESPIERPELRPLPLALSLQLPPLYLAAASETMPSTI